MRQVPNHRLWLGHAGDLRDPRAVLAVGIAAVVELADSESPASLPRDLIHCRFPLSDGGPNAAWLLRLAIETTAGLLTADVPTLLCCASGLSRSPCVAAAAIARKTGEPLADVLTRIVQSGPADVSPALFAQLQAVLDD